MKIPKEVINIISRLESAGFEAYVVGGCVRDLVIGRTPKDWDVTTSAKPEEIQKLFAGSFYENKFLTVTVRTDSGDPLLKEIEVTTFRAEGKYTDQRHPDEVRFARTLEEDLSRRDFTINAIALKVGSGAKQHELIDPFDGQKDINQKLIRTVGDPIQRFNEDALRLLRAVRLTVQLGCPEEWKIEEKTFEALLANASLLDMISKERVRDELIKIIMSDPYKHSGKGGAQEGIVLLKDTGLLHYIIPELEQGIGCTQNKHHVYTVFDHNMYSLGFAAKFGYNLETRLAALLHDVGKPKSKRGEGPDSTFYGHEVVGANMTKKILKRLKFPDDIVQKVTTLVRYHLFYYNVDEVTMPSVRRLVVKVGTDNMKDLVHLRMSERLGSGVPKAKPYKLRHFEFMVEKALHDPISVIMLKVNGYDIMETLSLAPGPKIGNILNAFMNEVLDEPSKNEREYMLKRIHELGALDDAALQELGKEGKMKIGEGEERWEDDVKKKHYVK